jgi:hypothetical protein
LLTPDVSKIKTIGNANSGVTCSKSATYKTLLENEDKAIQKILLLKPLIDWVWLLVLIAILLATEFIRKYNGLL